MGQHFYWTCLLIALCFNLFQCQYLLDSISNIVNYYSDVYDNQNIIMGNSYLEPCHTLFSGFMFSYNYFNLVKGNTCFKGQDLCIGLI